MKKLSSKCYVHTIETSATELVDFFKAFIKKDAIPYYTHALAFHVPQFFKLYGGQLSALNQQGQEKQSDVTIFSMRNKPP